MRLIRLGAACLNQTPLDWEGNRERIVGALGEARRAGVSVLCLPELAISGYGCEDAFHSPGVAAAAIEMLGEMLPETAGLVVALGLPVLYRNGLFNAACLVVDGEILGLTAKRFLAGDGIHYEPRWFKAWPRGRCGRVTFLGREVPIGDLHFDVGGVRLGVEICEDAWAANRPGAALSGKGIDLILNPSASHFAFGKHETRMRCVLDGSRAFGVGYVYANLLGNESGRVIYPGGALIAAAGTLVARGPRFSFGDTVLTTATVDLDATRMVQARSASFAPAPDRGAGSCPRSDFSPPEAAPEPAVATMSSWETGPDLKEEEFTRAVALGLFDYLRKSRSGGFVVSLSGGADSSAVSCLVAFMAGLGLAELGAEGLRRRLGVPGVPSGAANAREFVAGLLSCVYQRTEQSSPETRAAARGVAEAIGARFHDLDVGGLANGYVAMIEGAVGRRLDWARDDLALQNIQARTRAPGVWLLANLSNALLLATSNRSEAAVGYATMDGDTCGGLSPIAGVDKVFIRRWLAWARDRGPAGLGPVPALAAVTCREPTAELKPPGAGQTDEGELMPYEVLDAVERAAVGEKRTPVDVYRLLRSRFRGHSRADLGAWIARFFRLWCRNQWKRERYAPSFHLDDRNLDPRSWCRFPILSGGYERELRELERFMAKEE